MDGELVAIKDGLAFQDPESILYGLGAWSFGVLLIEEPRQPAPKAPDLERPGFRVPLDWDRGIGLSLWRMKQFHTRIERQSHQACGLAVGTGVAVRIHLAQDAFH